MFRTILSKAVKRQLHVLSTQNIIKPASPTPPHLKCYNLSPIDQFAPKQYIPMVFYYPNSVPNPQQDTANRLKLSLSETLVKYYPFAGRLNNSGAYVDCNDQGVEFQEVHTKFKLSEILEKSNGDKHNEALDLVFPNGLVWGNINHTSSMLVIRLTHFDCGGVSIAVCLSHKLADAKSFATFMTFWSMKMRLTNSTTLTPDDLDKCSPHFISYPSLSDCDEGAIIVPEHDRSPKRDWATQKFVFPNSKITKLKEMVAEKSRLQNITRVEVVTALLYKCFTAVTTAISGSFSPTVLVVAVNMRQKMVPPIPELSAGNIFSVVFISTENKSETNLDALVEKIKKAKLKNEGMKVIDVSEINPTIIEFARNNYNFFFCSSLTGMNFYRVDFGWGNPCRVSIPDTPDNNSVVLMDMPTGDGIEAIVSLEENHMAALRSHKDIQEFTSSE